MNYSKNIQELCLTKVKNIFFLYEKSLKFFATKIINKTKNFYNKSLINIFNNIRSMYPLQYGKNQDYYDDECIKEVHLIQMNLF